MIQCKDCHAHQYEGALFCSECGSMLTQEPGNTTDVLPFADSMPRPLISLPPDCRVEAPPLEMPITFVIPHRRRRHVVVLREQIVVGRSGRESEAAPELDLGEDNGAELGVSRFHAALQWSNYGLVVSDLGSTNGTLLNNSRLPAQRPFPLRSGDELRFGDLLVHVFFD
jgi:hypothetical protein